MVAANRMAQSQIDELVTLVRADERLWAEFKNREHEGDLRLRGKTNEGPKLPSMAMLVEEAVQRKYGPNHLLIRGDLILALRALARAELGLPLE